jgi:hypothetical protein
LENHHHVCEHTCAEEESRTGPDTDPVEGMMIHNAVPKLRGQWSLCGGEGPMSAGHHHRAYSTAGTWVV